MDSSEDEDPNKPSWARVPTEGSALSSGRSFRRGGGGGAGGGGGNYASLSSRRDDGDDEEGEYLSDSSDGSGVETRRGVVPRGPLLNLFLTVSACTVTVALGVAVAQVLIVVYLRNVLSVFSMALRVYNVLFCFIIIFTELGWTKLSKNLGLLQNWLMRGIAYAFVALLTLEEAKERDLPEGAATLYVEAIAYALLGVGGLYALMGLCCLHALREREEESYMKLVEHQRRVQALEAHDDTGDDDSTFQ